MPKKQIWTTRMQQLMRMMISADKCTSATEFYETVGFVRSNAAKLKDGTVNFTVEQLVAAARKYKVSMDWLTGLTNQMARVESKSALEQLRQAVKAVEIELKGK